MLTRRAIVLGSAASLPLLRAAPAEAAPKAEPWPRWERNDPGARETVDHAAWGGFLARHVRPGGDGVTRLGYGGVGQADRGLLKGYIAGLAGTAVSGLGRREQMAYWINLYNALTVDVVLDAYPVRSIRDIDTSPGLFSDGPWGKKLVAVEGEPVSLDDIEHRVLRPIWRDPRVHYAVNCASIGCPNLLAEPFTSGRLDALLDKGAADYVNHPRGARVDGRSLVVSSIYVWFKADFGGDDAGVLRHLAAHGSPKLAQQLQGKGRIDDHGYDWRLNDGGMA